MFFQIEKREKHPRKRELCIHRKDWEMMKNSERFASVVWKEIEMNEGETISINRA